jgi:hypothetical protein
MTTIKLKTGKCCDCPDTKGEQPLTAGRCRFHYWAYRKKVKEAKRPQVNKYQDNRDLNNWFQFQISHMPKCCENCGEYLNPYAPWGAKAYIAHIVPKRHFDSVKMHVLNRLFLCIQCHGDYDNRGEAKVLTMPVILKAVERFKAFADKIAPEECRYLPSYLLEILEHD